MSKNGSDERGKEGGQVDSSEIPIAEQFFMRAEDLEEKSMADNTAEDERMKYLADAKRAYGFAANMGSLRAYHKLGLHCQIMNDSAGAERNYKVAADGGYSPSQCNLGLVYLNHPVAKPNYAEAIRYLKMSVTNKNPSGMTNLAACYAKGLGVEQDPGRAKELQEEASKYAEEDLRLFEVNEDGVIGSDGNPVTRILSPEATTAKGNVGKKYDGSSSSGRK